jgi:3-carboxy-cis,cis-muconate cycloisomerase
MCANLDLMRGRIMAEALSIALAVHLGRQTAQEVARELLDRATNQGISLHQAAEQDARVQALLGPDTLPQIFDPRASFGSAEAFINCALAEFRALPTQGGTDE